MATEHTRLIYVTTGVLLQKLVAAKTLNEFSHIFVDEVRGKHDSVVLTCYTTLSSWNEKWVIIDRMMRVVSAVAAHQLLQKTQDSLVQSSPRSA